MTPLRLKCLVREKPISLRMSNPLCNTASNVNSSVNNGSVSLYGIQLLLPKAAVLIGLPAMADVFSKKKRSQVMGAIRDRGNKDTEIRLIQILRARGITGWRRLSTLSGRPDFVFPRRRVAVFVDGC